MKAFVDDHRDAYGVEQICRVLMSIVTTLIPDRRDLCAQALAQLELHSIVLPELPGVDEIEAFFSAASGETLEAWAFEDGGTPEPCVGSIEAIVDFYVAKGVLNVLAVDRHSSGIWVPQDHDFYVVFGSKKRLDDLKTLPMFELGFDDYLAEPYHSEAARRHLKRIHRTYTMGSED